MTHVDLKPCTFEDYANETSTQKRIREGNVAPAGFYVAMFTLEQLKLPPEAPQFEAVQFPIRVTGKESLAQGLCGVKFDALDRARQPARSLSAVMQDGYLLGQEGFFEIGYFKHEPLSATLQRLGTSCIFRFIEPHLDGVEEQ